MKEFKYMIFELKQRKYMFVRGSSFFNLCDFINGYCLALQMVGNQKPHLEFYDWLQNKLKPNSNLYWSDIIYNLKGKDDVEAEKYLFELLEEFFTTVNE